MSTDDKHVPELDRFANPSAADPGDAFKVVAAICMQALGIEANQFGREYQADNLTAEKIWSALRTVRSAIELCSGSTIEIEF